MNAVDTSDGQSANLVGTSGKPRPQSRRAGPNAKVNLLDIVKPGVGKPGQANRLDHLNQEWEMEETACRDQSPHSDPRAWGNASTTKHDEPPRSTLVPGEIELASDVDSEISFRMPQRTASVASRASSRKSSRVSGGPDDVMALTSRLAENLA